jgi:hypothetical protein
MVVLHPHMNTFVWSTNQDRFPQTPPFGHSCSLPSCKAHNLFYVGPPFCLSQRLERVMQRLFAMDSKSLLANSCIYLIDSISDWHIGFCPWSFLNPFPTFSSLGCVSSLDLMMSFNMTKSHGNLLSSHHFGEHKVCMELSKNLMLSRLQKLSYVFLCCVLVCG